MSAFLKLSLCVGLLLTSPGGRASAQAFDLPALQSPADALSDPEIKRALALMVSGQNAISIGVAVDPSESLVDRVNRIHLGMTVLGWTFVDQELVPAKGGSLMLLTYRR